ncbi:hypothetical protein BJV77DRAFT_1066602 [Russula vinacea]|nr:hypothetical protein BJV77DRAFT_1066602 [Russula vinacea]
MIGTKCELHDISPSPQNSIEVDQELQPHAVIRELTLDGDDLLATFYTLTVRLARLTLNSFLENVDLVVRTIGQFADDAEQQSAHPIHTRTSQHTG